MSISTPYGISYLIHGHNGYNGIERIPHVHVRCQGKTVSISLQNCNILAGHGQLDRNKERDVLEWVYYHKNELLEEWDEKSDPYR